MTGHFDVEEALEGGERELRRLVVASFLEAEPAHAVEHVRIDGRQTVGVFKKAARLGKVHVSGHPQVGERVARLNVVGIVGEDVLENGLGLFEVTDVLGDHRRIVGEGDVVGLLSEGGLHDAKGVLGPACLDEHPGLGRHEQVQVLGVVFGGTLQNGAGVVESL